MSKPISVEMRPLNLIPGDVFNNAPITMNSMPRTVSGRTILSQHFSELLSSAPQRVFKVPRAAADDIGYACGRVYAALVDSLGLLFDEHRDMIPYFFGISEDTHGDFIDYATNAHHEGHKALYGRFDVIADKYAQAPKIIEFNGDTPVMLFESTVMQNVFAERAGGTGQFNHYHELTTEAFQMLELRGKRIGIVAEFSAVEDLLTSETLYHMMKDSGLDVTISPLGDFLFEPLQINCGNSPFVIHGRPMDVVFMLHPWEEMIESTPEIIRDWRSWNEYVRFMEPAWRWFVSNKGALAWLHWLIKHRPDTDWSADYADDVIRYVPYTEMHQAGNLYLETRYIKPVTGRLSSNVKKVDGDRVEANGGSYADARCISQVAVSHVSFDGSDQKPLFGVWMAPSVELASEYWDPLCMEAGCLSIRISTWRLGDHEHAEEFAPHVIEEAGE